VLENHEDIVKLLIAAGANVNSKSTDSETALMWAVSDAGNIHNNISIAKLLIAAGADINSKDNHDKTALSYAAESGREDFVKLLQDAGGKMSLIDEFMYSIAGGNLTFAKQLLEAGININSRGTYNVTALMVAVMKGQTHVVKPLVEAGIDINAVEDN